MKHEAHPNQTKAVRSQDQTDILEDVYKRQYLESVWLKWTCIYSALKTNCAVEGRPIYRVPFLGLAYVKFIGI